jgi:hypothetical protein
MHIDFIYGLLLGLAIWPLYRLFRPFRCECGYTTLSADRMFEHTQMRHAHKKRRK